MEPNRGDTADGPGQQGRERERDGDDERLGEIGAGAIGEMPGLGTGAAG